MSLRESYNSKLEMDFSLLGNECFSLFFIWKIGWAVRFSQVSEISHSVDSIVEGKGRDSIIDRNEGRNVNKI
jgi:hypothetical protein